MSMETLFEGLEKMARIQEAMETADQVVKGSGWFYVPSKTYLGGTLKPIVHEINDKKWEILFCAPQTSVSSKAQKGAKSLMASKEIEKYQELIVNEAVEGDTSNLNKWYVKARWSGSFEDTLKKCVAIVEGKSDAAPSNFVK